MQRIVRAHLFFGLAVVLVACGSVRGEDELLTGAGTGETGGRADTDGASGETAGLKLDVGGGSATATAGDGSGQGCEKIDFLFVIDNSSSMADQQDSLIRSFPGFIETIEDTLNIQDFHVLVVDTDEWGPLHEGTVQHDHACTPWLSSNPVAAICDPPHADCCGMLCDEYPMRRCDPANGGGPNGVCGMPPDACDMTLGAGVVRDYPTLQRCPIVGDQRYLTADQTDLESVFECIAQVGEDGNFDERPMQAMMQAIDANTVGPGGCNEGFLRDDAILVVTILSDAIPESACEQQSPTPQVWRDALVEAKHGDPAAVVVLGLFSGMEPYGHQERCRTASHGYFDLLDHFGDNALAGSICEPDYSPFFREAVEKRITGACEDFVPPEG